MADCIFCEIVAGRLATTVLHRDELVTAFRDSNPQAPTHILIVPNVHVDSAADIGRLTSEMLTRAFTVAASLAESEGISTGGYRLVTNVGRDAGQSVPHLHFHLLGGRRLRWPPR